MQGINVNKYLNWHWRVFVKFNKLQRENEL